MSVETVDFVDAYLADREQNPAFTMVEIGHDTLPVAYQQPFEFSGDRVYHGFEAWNRDPIGEKRKHLANTQATRNNGPNVFYHSLDLGGTVIRDEESNEAWYAGEYNVAIDLPNGVADEVFESNVLGDHRLAGLLEHTQQLLAESARLINTTGMIVLRETISPQFVIFLTNKIIEDSGLEIKQSVGPSNLATWKVLETIYKAEPAEIEQRPDCFYLFLAKTSLAA